MWQVERWLARLADSRQFIFGKCQRSPPSLTSPRKLFSLRSPIDDICLRHPIQASFPLVAAVLTVIAVWNVPNNTSLFGHGAGPTSISRSGDWEDPRMFGSIDDGGRSLDQSKARSCRSS